MKLYPVNDGKIRVVDVLMANGKQLRHPVNKLCIMDVKRRDEENDQTENNIQK